MNKTTRFILAILSVVLITCYVMSREYEVDPAEAAFQKEMEKRSCGNAFNT
jgi:hypothetical protein